MSNWHATRCPVGFKGSSIQKNRKAWLSLAKTLGVLSFTPLTMLQACAQAVDFKVGHHFGEGHRCALVIFEQEFP
jgi:hypothetical protein